LNWNHGYPPNGFSEEKGTKQDYKKVQQEDAPPTHTQGKKNKERKEKKNKDKLTTKKQKN
jgi:hypothetical protein